MTSQRRKLIKWEKWKRKNPDRADAAQLRKIGKLFAFGRCFTRQFRRRFDKVCKDSAHEPNPFTFVIKPQIQAIGFRMKLPELKDADAY